MLSHDYEDAADLDATLPDGMDVIEPLDALADAGVTDAEVVDGEERLDAAEPDSGGGYPCVFGDVLRVGSLNDRVSGYDGLFVSTTEDGRWVAFSSTTSLVPGDSNGLSDAYLLDRLRHTYELLSALPDGSSGPGASYAHQISDDGRFVLMTSHVRLSPRDPGNRADLYIRDRRLGVTELVSDVSPPVDGAGGPYAVAMSGDGKTIAWITSPNRQLVLPDGNGPIEDILVRDRRRGLTTRANVNSRGDPADGQPQDVALSRDGRFVVFQDSGSTNLPDQGRPGLHIYIHDLTTGATELVDTSSMGVASRASVGGVSVSGDGRYVAFLTDDPALTGAPEAVLRQVVVKDRVTGAVSVESRDHNGDIVQATPGNPNLSPDGRFIEFHAEVADLAGDPPPYVARPSIYVRARGDRELRRIAHGSVPNDPFSLIGERFPKAHWSAGADFLSFASALVLVPEAAGGQSDGYVFSFCQKRR